MAAFEGPRQTVQKARHSSSLVRCPGTSPANETQTPTRSETVGEAAFWKQPDCSAHASHSSAARRDQQAPTAKSNPTISSLVALQQQRQKQQLAKAQAASAAHHGSPDEAPRPQQQHDQTKQQQKQEPPASVEPAKVVHLSRQTAVRTHSTFLRRTPAVRPPATPAQGGAPAPLPLQTPGAAAAPLSTPPAEVKGNGASPLGPDAAVAATAAATASGTRSSSAVSERGVVALVTPPLAAAGEAAAPYPKPNVSIGMESKHILESKLTQHLPSPPLQPPPLLPATPRATATRTPAAPRTAGTPPSSAPPPPPHPRPCRRPL
jgi:hypothetical protein